MENWKPAIVRKNINGHVTFLHLKGVLVSDRGRLMRKSTGNIIKTYDANMSPSLSMDYPKNNYQKCRLPTVCGKATNVKVHNVVLSTFNPSTSPYVEIDHLDGDKTNNALSNLEWVTRAENIRRAHNSSK